MIYLLEDDEGIRKFVTYALKQAGLEAMGFGLPSEFYNALKTQIPDLVLLDIMLPEEDGLSVLSRIRNSPDTKGIPVIMLTAKSSEYDKVLGLDSGADDYISKPFGTMELISRIKALLRRTGKEHEEYRFKELRVNPEKHLVMCGEQEITITIKEFELLCLMMKNQGTVFSRDTLLNRIWGYGYDGESRTVDVHIKTLRTKLGDCGEFVKTVRGLGYKIG